VLERTTIFVDTSYLLASFYNSWEEGAREQLEVSLSTVVQTLDQIARKQSKQPTHRQFWYDGVPDSGPHRYQRTLRVIDGVILRTGQLIEWGNRRSQKAVDTRLVADMVLAAFRGQCTDMVLVSGDADMIPGVEAAIEAGVRVHLVGFGWDSVSSALRNACDTSLVLDPRTDFAESMQIRVLEGPLPTHVCGNRPAQSGEGKGGAEGSSVDIEDVDFQPGRARDESVAGAHERRRSRAESRAEAEKSDREKDSGEKNDAEKAEGAKADGKHAAGESAEAATDSATEVKAENDGEGAVSTPAGGTSSAPVESGNAAGEPSGAASDAIPEDTAARSQPSAAGELADPAGDRAGGDATAEIVETDEVGSEDGTSAVMGGNEHGQPGEEQHGRPRGRSTVTVTHRSVTITARAERHGYSSEHEDADGEREGSAAPRPNPSMMAPRRRPVRSRYVPLTEEVWSSSGDPSPFDVGQQYATWWYKNAADEEQKLQAHTLTGGALPPEVDRPLLQFACQMLHEFTLNEFQRVALRDGFHEGIRGIVMQK